MAAQDGLTFEGTFNDATTGEFKTNTTQAITSLKLRKLPTAIRESYLNRIDDVKDEDDMASNSAAAVPSQQSVKAYVDAQVAASTVADGDKGDVVVSSSGTVWTVDAATATAAGKVELATPAESLTATDTARAVTPEGLYVITVDLLSVSTAGATVTLDFASKIQRLFVGSASFSSSKTIALSNTTNALVLNLVVTITNLAGTVIFPSTFTMQAVDRRWDDSTHTFTPNEIGKHEFSATWDGTDWNLKVSYAYS